MHPVRLLAPLALLIAAAAPAVANEQLPCTKFDHLAGFLADTYGERQVSAGLQSNGQLLQIFSSPETGSWTAVTTSPAGMACVVATGRHWAQDPGHKAEEAYNPASLRP